MKPYGIVGQGRAARHFAHYCDLLGIPYLTWSRKVDSPPLSLLIDRCDLILLLISDSAIEPFLTQHPELFPKKLVHFSGSLTTPLAHGMHPLMTFGVKLYELETYERMAFITEKGKPTLNEIFPRLPNRSFQIDANQKPLYHALCVMSGNFTTLLWQNLFNRFTSDLDLPRDIAEPYLQQITQNLLDAPERALTGPIARRDYQTIRRNLHSLENDPFQGIYQSFCNAFLEPESTPSMPPMENPQ